MRDLSSLTTEEFKIFFSSFDQILSDVEGVLWNLLEPIPGSPDAVAAFKKMGKRFGIVTNNTIMRFQDICENFQNADMDIKESEIMTPIPSIISYLKSQNLQDKKIFVIGMAHLKEALENSGFKLAENEPYSTSGDIKNFANHCIAEEENIGAVLFDMDFNLNYRSMQKALSYLRNPEILFLCGPRDEKFPAGKNKIFIGPGSFINILEAMSERKVTLLAKRGSYFNACLIEKFKITDCSKVLFIGDSISEDMGIAAKNGFKKLLVLSGASTKADVENWNYPEEYKPDFYVDSLKTVYELSLRI